MNITKDYFEKQLKKSDKVTVYTQDNIPLTISKAPCIRRDDVRLELDMPWMARLTSSSPRASADSLETRLTALPPSAN